jgi:hypothetical protein
MSAQVIAINRQTWRRCGGAAWRFSASEVGGKAKAMFGLLVALLLDLEPDPALTGRSAQVSGLS